MNHFDAELKDQWQFISIVSVGTVDDRANENNKRGLALNSTSKMTPKYTQLSFTSKSSPLVLFHKTRVRNKICVIFAGNANEITASYLSGFWSSPCLFSSVFLLSSISLSFFISAVFLSRLRLSLSSLLSLPRLSPSSSRERGWKNNNQHSSLTTTVQCSDDERLGQVVRR